MIAMISLSNISQMNFSIVNSILNKLQIQLAENNFTEIEKTNFCRHTITMVTQF